MTGILNALIAGVSGAVKDAYFNLVSLLLPGNGTNGAQNNTFLDGSSNNFTITRNGNTTQGTFSPFSQTGWGAYFDGSNDYVTATLATALTSTYTIDFWINTNSVAAGDKCILNIHTTSSNTVGFVVKRNGSQIQVNDGATGGTGPSGGTLAVGVWKFVTIVCNATNTLLYIDGSLVNTYSGVTLSGSPTFVHIGSFGDLAAGNYADAYISNLRIIVGSAITPSATPPTSPSQSTGSTTKLLTLQSNRFVDNGTNSLTVTPNNGVAITPFSPFAPTQAYSAAAVGGSGYFDGTGDYLSVADNTAINIGTSDFQIGFWIYPTAFAGSTASNVVFSKGTNNIVVNFNNSGTLSVGQYGVATRVTASSNITLNQWAYVVVSRVSNTTKIFLNGTEVGSASDTSNYTSTSAAAIGQDILSSTQIYFGYITDFRLIKGSGVTSVTVPTAPLTAITNTSLLLNFTNAGVVDATAKNVLETVGNAQISTTQSKWGGGSMSFDGTGDYLLAPVDANQNYNFGSGDFTVECWFYANSLSTTAYAGLMGCNNANVDGNTSAWAAYVRSNGIFFYGNTGTLTGVAGTVNTGVWNHYAVTRSGNTLRLFLNGTQTTSATVTGTYTNSTVGFRVGDEPDSANPAFNGYIDDLRITKGYARYVEGTGGNAGKMVFNGTNTLALPTAPFPVQ